MTRRITIQSGDYILLSDIPNEQVFNLVKECFGNAGYNSVSVWEEQTGWSAFYAHSDGFVCHTYSCFVFKGNANCLRQLSLSDVFNSTNGSFDWQGEIKWWEFKCPEELQPFFDRQRIEAALNTTFRTAPQGMTREQKRAFMSGKSTAHHLELISKAMKNPEMWVEITSDYDNLQRHHRSAFEEVRALCHKLNLDWMEFSVSGNSMRYMPYQTVKMVTKWERV